MSYSPKKRLLVFPDFHRSALDRIRYPFGTLIADRGIAMNLAIRLLIAIGKAGHGLGNFITSLSVAAWLHSADMEAITKWFRSTPQEQQKLVEQLRPLTEQEQALLTKFEQLMQTGYEVSELQRCILTLPALPEEGF
jgi:hypothetical protein